jgi:RNA-directed DNA polymerase
VPFGLQNPPNVRNRWTRIQPSKCAGFKQKVKQLSKRNGGINLAEITRRLNPVLRGAVNYFSITILSERY